MHSAPRLVIGSGGLYINGGSAGPALGPNERAPESLEALPRVKVNSISVFPGTPCSLHIRFLALPTDLGHCYISWWGLRSQQAFLA